MQMVIKLHSTFLWLFSLLLLKSLGLHLLFLLRRELALHRIQEKRRERAEKIAAEEITDSEIPMPSAAEDEATDISQLNQQTRKLLDSSITILFLFGLWLIWSGMLPALGVFSRIELWHDIQPVTEQTLSLNPSSANNPAQTAPLINTQMTAITLADLLLSIIMFFITWIAVNNLPGLLEISILQRLSLPNAQCYAIVTLFRYAIIFTGIALALNIIGIGWSKIQWLAAAFTVGLGFGLQEIFANFAAGLIILFEQPVRKGDIITINDISGVVSKIRIRTTTITDFNRKDLIVPNKDFITTRVINWTLSDSVLRLVIPVGVAYGSDVEKVEKILLDIAEEHPKVLDNPPSFVVLQKFGESSIDFDFRIFIDDLDSYTIIWNDILVSIYKKFKDEGIQIPFPQRDLHIKESPVYYNKVLNGE
jgi:potassium efflux system protein